MELTYKTREHIPPQGLPQVYFTGHPADYPRFFEEIAEEILSLQNCAVYFDARPEEAWDEEELYDMLGQMKLFVIPVTARFLREENRARNKEFPFAVSHHIPVLPLLKEAGLEEEFNRICGNWQILAREDVADRTKAWAGKVLNYRDKLKNYLSSVLVADELAEQIREAFDAYVFLSYRKKDRSYAQRLMKLIHQHDFCRDIAIWYDEFLIPGEDFNSAIGNALAKSQLFVMTVTPSLLEEGNYVATTEYPKAEENGKSILPVKMTDTDSEKLREMYKDIPDCVDSDDGIILSQALLSSFKCIALRKKAQDPRHNFFIGLAYLSGIDVEVDFERALSLIMEAAMDGLPDAAAKLADMYHTGNGVEMDYHKAVEWQEYLVKLLRSVYEQSNAPEDARELNTALRCLGDYYLELGEFLQAEQVYLESMELCRQQVNEGGDRYALLGLSASCDLLGVLSLKQGDYEWAIQYFEEGLEMDLRLFEQYDMNSSDSLEELRNLSVSYNHVGELCLQCRQWERAERFFSQSLPFCMMVYRGRVDWETTSDLATTLEGQARAVYQEGEGDVARARGIFQEVVTYRETALKQEKSPQTLFYLANSYFNFALTDKGTEALDAMGQAYLLCKQLREQFPWVEDYKRLADLCCQGLMLKLEEHAELSNQYKEMGDQAAAARHSPESLNCYRQAMAYLLPILKWKVDSGLSDDYGPEEHGAMAEIFRCQARAEKEMHRLDNAIPFCEEALAILEPLVRGTNTLKNAQRLCRAYYTAGDVYLEAENIPKADQYYRKGIDLCQKLYDETHDSFFYGILAQYWFNQAVVAYYQSGPEEVSRLVKLSEAAWCKLAMLYPDDEEFRQQREWTREQLAPCLSGGEKEILVQMQEAGRYRVEVEERIKEGDIVKAFHAVCASLNILAKVCDASVECGGWIAENGLNAYRGMCDCYERMGDIFMMDGQFEEAQKNYENALRLRRKLANRFEQPEDCEALADACIRIGRSFGGTYGWQLLEEAEKRLCLLCMNYCIVDRYERKRKELLSILNP